MLGARNANCPNCGGPIEFALGSSAALVCPHCRYSVVRTDRDLQAIGRVADLVPTASPIAVGDSGTLGGRGFRVAGRMQLDTGSGPWDEWYIGFDDDGSWAWLARAQGSLWCTQETDASGVPAYEQMSPGHQGTLPGSGGGPWTITERGTSTLLSAEGELPFAVLPGMQGRYVDLSRAGGAVGTIDYGDGREAVKLFTGHQVPRDDLVLAQTAGGPRPEQKVALGKLSCPSCGAPVEIHAPEITERAACSYCYTLLDLDQGNLSILEKLDQPKIIPLIPLGSQGNLDGEDLKVIGFMERFTVLMGITYRWREYLLYGRNGYRWLLEDSHHWTLLRPVAAGEVSGGGSRPRFDGKVYKQFTLNSATVRFVIGEFYWQVEVGDTSQAADFIAPPLVLSRERTENEVNWSAGHYIEGKDLWKAFKLSGSPPAPRGIAPAQPNPNRLKPKLLSFAALFVLFAVMLFALEFRGSSRVLIDGPLLLPATQAGGPIAATAPAVDPASYTPVFEVTRDTVLQVDLNTNADNDYVGVACALINEDTGEIREFHISTEYNHGVSGGESWSEGDRNVTEYVPQVDAGRYTLRMQPEWSHWSGGRALFRPNLGLRQVGVPIPQAQLKVTQDRRSSLCCLFTFLLLLAPLPISVMRKGAFEGKRWAESSFGSN